MDIASDLEEAWAINGRICEYLLDAIPESSLDVPLTKGRSVRKQFGHIHNVRLMWLKSRNLALLEGQEKIEREDLTKTEIRNLLAKSSDGVLTMIKDGLSVGRIKGFKPHPTAFVAYMIAHEACHRGHIEIALRQGGVPVDDKTSFGIWEWGSR